jgi:hypothetical protein
MKVSWGQELVLLVVWHSILTEYAWQQEAWTALLVYIQLTQKDDLQIHSPL